MSPRLPNPGRENSEATTQSAIVTALRACGFVVHVNTAGHRGRGKVRAPYSPAEAAAKYLRVT